MDDRGKAVYALLRQMRPIVLHSARVVEQDVRPLGWTVASRAVVEVLRGAGDLTVPQVAARLSLARQNVQRHVDELVSSGEAETVANPAHRRSVLVRLTPHGTATFDALHARELKALSKMATECSEAELTVTLHVLEALDRDIHTRSPSRSGEASR